MSEHRILLVESPAQLAIERGRLKIARAGLPDAFAAPADVTVLCLHHHTITLSAHVLRTLALAGTTVLVMDGQHLPCALLLPTAGNQALIFRLHQQIGLDTLLAKELWAQLVRAKIAGQAANLRHFSLNGALRLERLAKNVRAGDPENTEAQAARHYWKRLFGASFTRHKQGASDTLNIQLNYGYAVLRALVARQLAMSGLTPALGLGHRNLQNPFNLADDFVEPFRFLIERHIRAHGMEMAEFNSSTKVCLLRFIEMEVTLGGRTFRFPSAIAETVASFCRVLEKGGGALLLPG